MGRMSRFLDTLVEIQIVFLYQEYFFFIFEMCDDEGCVSLTLPDFIILSPKR